MVDGIHFIDLVEFDDHIHILSCDKSELKLIVVDRINEVDGVTLGQRMLIVFRLVPDVTSVQSNTIEPLIFPCYSVQTPFILILAIVEVHTLNVEYVIRESRVV